MMSTPIEMITTNKESEASDAAALQAAGFYWRERDGVRALICAPLERDGFTNAFSTRLGGVSPMPDQALNLAGFNEDDAANIYENRRRFLKLFDDDWVLTGCWQVHGIDVRVVHSEAEAKTKPGVLGDDEYCDALVSNTPKVLLTVKTADCVPVLIGDHATRAFAAVHAGWRGTSSSIVRNAITQLSTEYGTRPEDLRAAINHHAKENLHTGMVRVTLPPRSPPRTRWLTRDEAARLTTACVCSGCAGVLPPRAAPCRAGD